MQVDRPEGKPDEKVAWGSDIAAQMLRRFGIPFISLNPGASYRGLHDSLVNHLGNERPGIILCLHEDHSVAIAHGYAKATGEPMACVLHSNVGLLHGMMGIFNAWCDRVPMIVLGATGPVDAEKRRPWIDWIHTSRDQGALHPLASSSGTTSRPRRRRWWNPCVARQSSLTRTRADRAGLYLPRRRLPGGRLDKEPEWPDLKRFHAAEAVASVARSAVDQAAAELLDACRTSRSSCSAAARARPSIWQPRIRSPSGSAPAWSPISSRAPCSRPTIRHTTLPPFNVLAKDGARAHVRGRRHPVARLDRSRRRAAPGQERPARSRRKIINATLDQNLHNGANMEYQALPAVRRARWRRPTDVVVAELHRGARRRRRKEPWKAARAGQAASRRTARLTMEQSPRRCATSSTIPRT